MFGFLLPLGKDAWVSFVFPYTKRRIGESGGGRGTLRGGPGMQGPWIRGRDMDFILLDGKVAGLSLNFVLNFPCLSIIALRLHTLNE